MSIEIARIETNVNYLNVAMNDMQEGRPFSFKYYLSIMSAFPMIKEKHRVNFDYKLEGDIEGIVSNGVFTAPVGNNVNNKNTLVTMYNINIYKQVLNSTIKC